MEIRYHQPVLRTAVLAGAGVDRYWHLLSGLTVVMDSNTHKHLVRFQGV